MAEIEPNPNSNPSSNDPSEAGIPIEGSVAKEPCGADQPVSERE